MLRKLEEVGGCVLADMMGLDKTVQLLGMIIVVNNDREDEDGSVWSLRGKPTLIVVPKSLVAQWKRECTLFLGAAYNVISCTTEPTQKLTPDVIHDFNNC